MMREKHSPLQLKEFISIDTLSEIIDQISAITGFSISLADYSGILFEEFENIFNPYCKKIRKSAIGGFCDKCDAYAGLEAARSGKPILYRCHLGAAETAVPLIIAGQYFGSILAGQVRLSDEEMERLDYITKPTNIDNNTLADLSESEREAVKNHYESLEMVSYNQLQATSQLLFLVANYIGEISYRSMMERRIKEYDMNLLREKNINVELERNLAAAQLKSMQSQMNPHFLFNTLNSIGQQAILEGADKTHELICALADIMRKLSRKEDETATLKEEFGYIDSYLQIVKAQMQSRISIIRDFEPICLQAKLPVFTVQPLVENAVRHGLEKKAEGGELRLSVHLNGSNVEVTVTDTGAGMDPQQLDQIKLLDSESAENNLPGNKSIGIINSIRILYDYFGDKFNWTIDSKVGEGTKFVLMFPFRTE